MAVPPTACTLHTEVEVHSEVCDDRAERAAQANAKTMNRIAAILPAAGLGTRMGAETPKQFLELDGVPIVILSLRRIAFSNFVKNLFLPTPSDEFTNQVYH